MHNGWSLPFSTAGQLTHLYCCSIPEHSCICTLSITVDGGMLCIVCKPPVQRRRNHLRYQLAYIMFTADLRVPALVVNQSMDNGLHFIHMAISLLWRLQQHPSCWLSLFSIYHVQSHLFSFKCEGRILYPAAHFLVTVTYVWERWSCVWFILAPMANHAPAHIVHTGWPPFQSGTGKERLFSQ